MYWVFVITETFYFCCSPYSNIDGLSQKWPTKHHQISWQPTPNFIVIASFQLIKGSVLGSCKFGLFFGFSFCSCVCPLRNVAVWVFTDVRAHLWFIAVTGSYDEAAPEHHWIVLSHFRLVPGFKLEVSRVPWIWSHKCFSCFPMTPHIHREAFPISGFWTLRRGT